MGSYYDKIKCNQVVNSCFNICMLCFIYIIFITTNNSIRCACDDDAHIFECAAKGDADAPLPRCDALDAPIRRRHFDTGGAAHSMAFIGRRGAFYGATFPSHTHTHTHTHSSFY